MGKIHIVEKDVKELVDTRASAFVTEKHLTYKLGIWKCTTKVKVRQRDSGTLGGTFVINTYFNLRDSSLVLGKHTIDTEVLDIRNRDVMVGFCWLMKTEFLINARNRCLRNISTRHVISGSVRWIPVVFILEKGPLEDVEILLMIDISKQYCGCAQYISAEQAVRLPEHKS